MSEHPADKGETSCCHPWVTQQKGPIKPLTGTRPRTCLFGYMDCDGNLSTFMILMMFLHENVLKMALKSPNSRYVCIQNDWMKIDDVKLKKKFIRFIFSIKDYKTKN